MPKVKAYKGNGAIIPVDDAKISTAYKCPWTNEVFGTKKGYVNHLRVLREDRIHHAIRQRIRQKIIDDLNNQPTFDGIINWVETHPHFFFDEFIKNGRDRWGQRREHLRDKFWVKITYLDLVWSDNVSNSHSCPRDGVTNWNRDRDKPTGYPGWTGLIEFEVSHDINFGSDVFKGVGIHTGSGGKANGPYGYEVKFFASDWPGLEARRVFEILREDRPAGFVYGKKNYFR